MPSLSIDHIQITVPADAIAAARMFYCDMLGLTEIPKPESLIGRGGFWVKVGDHALHVGTEEGVDRQATKAHVAYRADDLEWWRARLTEAGVIILDSAPIPGYSRFEFRDPFGNRVEFITATHDS